MAELHPRGYPEHDLAPRHDVPSDGRSSFVRCGHRQVHYLTWGSVQAAPVVLLHGAGQSAYMYEELGAALRGQYFVLAPDLPDHGDSEPLGEDRWTREDLARSTLEFLDEMGVPAAVFVGASLGGITSIGAAKADPTRVAGMVLIDVAHRIDVAGRQRLVEFFVSTESFGSLDEAADVIARHLPNRRLVRVDNLQRSLRQRPDGRWVWKHGMGRRNRAEIERGIELPAVGDPMLVGFEADARGVRCPVLIVRGARSDILPEAVAQELTEIIPTSRLASVEGAGHTALGDKTEATIDLIRRFLDEIGWHHNNTRGWPAATGPA